VKLEKGKGRGVGGGGGGGGGGSRVGERRGGWGKRQGGVVYL